ncbi:MAG: dockerin type I repeat-containing protein [Clostridia bacterium]|nr:dockerin type I repeat-containing protein [Clostridia bacterium]
MKKIITVLLLICLVCGAAPVAASAVSQITAVTVTDVPVPVVSSYPVFSAAVDPGLHCSVRSYYNKDGYTNGIKWTDKTAGAALGYNDVFQKDREYTVSVLVAADGGYAFDASRPPAASVNGAKAEITVSSEKYAEVHASFTCASEKIEGGISIERDPVRVGEKIKVSKTGPVSKLAPGTVRVVWYISDDPRTPAAEGEVYTCRPEDNGKSLFAVVTADGYTGTLTSNTVGVIKGEHASDPVRPELEARSEGLFVKNAYSLQEYIVLSYYTDPAKISEAAWDGAVSPLSDGRLRLVNAIPNSVNYVYTRMKETDSCYAGTKTVYASVSVKDIDTAQGTGDVSGDGSVNNKDVVLLFRYITGTGVLIDEENADVNDDGKINNKDVVALFRYVSGY